MAYFCEMAFDHEPGETCEHCGLLVDEYGNTEEDYHNCSFPDCGCDGSRLCMAKNGASENSIKCNVEGMYSRKDPAAIRARLETYALSIKRNKK